MLHHLNTGRLLEFLHGLYVWQDTASLIEWIFEQLPALIPADNTMIGQHDPKTRTPLNVTIRHPLSRPHIFAELCEAGVMKDHPFWAPNPDPADPVKLLSEMMSSAEWERCPMYAEFMREDAVRDHMTIEFLDDGKLHYVAVARSKRGFHRLERETLRQLAPHFQQAFRSARLREEYCASSVAGAAGLVSMHPIDQRGRFFGMKNGLGDSLRRLFGARSDDLRDNLNDWLQQQVGRLNRGFLDTAIDPFFVSQTGRTVEFRLHRKWGSPGYVLSQHNILHRATGQTSLSPREREILEWVREGKANGEIAIILGLSRHTVKDHLKRILEKLGVDNRTAAARCVID